MISLLISSVLVMFASLSGKVLVWRGAGVFIERNLDLMVSFSAGVFLIFAYQLTGEAFHHAGLVPGVFWIAAGVVGISLMCKFLPHGTHVHKEKGAHLDAHRLLVSDSLHNVGDGIFLAATFALTPAFGLVATVSVFVHEVVQEIGEFFVLRDSGYSVKRALMLNFATSATILIGAIGGYFLLDAFEALEGPLLCLAAGGVLTVAFYDLLPHSWRDATSRINYSAHLFWFLSGCVLMYAIVSLVPHV